MERPDNKENTKRIFELNRRSSTPDLKTPLLFFSKSSSVDYYLFRSLFLKNNFYFLFDKLIVVAANCIEKLLKTYILSFEDQFNPKTLGHNLKEIRKKCSEIDSYFNKEELVMFCEQYSQYQNKIDGHQIFGYSDMTYVNSINADFEQLLNLLDEVFLETIIRMKNNNGLVYFDIFGLYVNDPRTVSMYKLPTDNSEDMRYVFFTKNNAIGEIYQKNKQNIYDRCGY